MEGLQSRWERRLEAEAKECEHPERIETLRSQMPLGDSSATNRIQEASENVSADKIRREAIIKKVQNPQTNTILSVRETALHFEVVPALHRWTDEGNLRVGVGVFPEGEEILVSSPCFGPLHY
jgi:hypothetical protein